MTPAPRAARDGAQIDAIVDRQIARWKSRGVLSTSIARRLHCHHSWAAIRASMLARLTRQQPPRRGRPPMQRTG